MIWAQGLSIEFLMTRWDGNEWRKVNVTLDNKSNTSICSTWSFGFVRFPPQLPRRQRVVLFGENITKPLPRRLPNIILISMPSPRSVRSSINRLLVGTIKSTILIPCLPDSIKTSVWDHNLWLMFFILLSSLVGKLRNDLDCNALPNLRAWLHLSMNWSTQSGCWIDYLSDDGSVFRNYNTQTAKKCVPRHPTNNCLGLPLVMGITRDGYVDTCVCTNIYVVLVRLLVLLLG